MGHAGSVGTVGNVAIGTEPVTHGVKLQCGQRRRMAAHSQGLERVLYFSGSDSSLPLLFDQSNLEKYIKRDYFFILLWYKLQTIQCAKSCELILFDDSE